MAEEEKTVPETEETVTPQSGEKPKSLWQIQKESWYDKIPLSLKQLDMIIGVCITLLILCFAAICLDALGIYNFFG